MKQNTFIITSVLLTLFCAAAVSYQASAEEVASETSVNFTEGSAITTPAVSEAVVPQEPLPLSSESQMQWILGKVVLLDLANNSVVVHYIDYDTNNERDLTFFVDNKTVYENAQSLADLKPDETVSIDYSIVDGKNIASVVGIEKVEEDSNSQPLPPAD